MAANKTIGNIPLGEKMNLSIAEASVYCRSICLYRNWTGYIKKMVKRAGLSIFDLGGSEENADSPTGVRGLYSF